MYKIRKADIREKKCIIVCMLLLFFVIVALFLLYKNQIQRVAVQPRSVLSVEAFEHFPETNAGIAELNDNTDFRQTLLMVSTKFDGISIWVDNKEDNSKGQLEISLKKEGEEQTIQSWSYEIDEFPHQGFINLFLDEPEKTEVGDRYILNVSARNTEDTVIKLQKVRGEDMAGTLSIDGNEQENVSLSYRINSGSCHALIYFFAIVSFVILFGIVIVLVLVIKRTQIDKLAFCLVMILGFLYIMVIPPYVTPDEPAHISTAYKESSEIIGKESTDSNGKVIGYEDMTSYLVRREIPNANSYVQYVRWLFGRTEAITESQTFELGSSLEVGMLGYTPQIIGMTLGRILQVNSIQLLFVGRLCALLFYAFITYMSVKLIPFGKNMLSIIAILPMTMQQAVSFSYDSVLNGVLFLLISYELYLIYSKQKISWKQILIILGLCTIVVPTKFIYIPVIGLCLLIPAEKFGGRRKKIVAGSAVVLYNMVMIFATNMKRVLELTIVTDKTNMKEVSDLVYYTVSYVIGHPLETIEVFANTIMRDGSYYVETMIGQHLGWLDIEIGSVIVLGFILLLMISIVQKEGEPYIKVKDKYLMIGIVSVVFILILFSLLMAETYIGSETVLGVQGRYFLPMLPLVILSFQNRIIILKKDITAFIVCGGMFLNIAAIINIMGVLLTR